MNKSFVLNSGIILAFFVLTVLMVYCERNFDIIPDCLQPLENTAPLPMIVVRADYEFCF